MTQPSPLRFAVIGHPVAHSQSPFIHQEFARQTGISLSYEKILAPLDGFAACVQNFFDAGGRGLNVTLPFKQEAWQLASAQLSPFARLAGAVNTLWQAGGRLHGCNTDGSGLVDDLRRLGHDPKEQRILLLGAGGAARGALPALLDAGCARIHVANRSPEKARQLCAEMARQTNSRVLTASGLESIAGQWDVVINATSASLQPGRTLAPDIDYAGQALAYDMVYAAKDTPFLMAARERGASHCADGLGMLVGQAAASFAIWHGVQPSMTPVLKALRARMQG